MKDLTITKISTINFPTTYGNFLLTTYSIKSKKDPYIRYILAIHSKNIANIPVIRIHSSCMFSEILHSTLCDCREQLRRSMIRIKKKNGILFYLDQEGRSHGLINKTKEILLQQEKGLDTVEASLALGLKIDQRDFTPISVILKRMKILTVSIMSNNPDKIASLIKNGIKVKKIYSLRIKPNVFNKKYLKTKKSKLGHNL